MSRQREFDSLLKGLEACRRCQDLFGFEPRPVARGNRSARIVQISQAPGAKVHESGKPFTDQSGKTLREEWYQIDEDTFYDPDLFYFAMAGHCYPGKNFKGGGDRKPPACCYELWTRNELDLLEGARLYLVIGQEALSRLFGKNAKLKDYVFEEQTYRGKPCFVLPHPSPLNRGWLKKNPQFEEIMLPKTRKAIRKALEEAESR